MPKQAKHNKPVGDHQGKSAWYDMSAKASQADVYIYSEIGYWGITANQFAKDLKELGNVSEITVHINSMGGSVGDGIAIFNTLKKHKAKITVEIDGYALSMGSVIAMCGDKIVMADNALMMIHNPWGYARGDADELRKAAEVSDKHKTILIKSYQKRTELDEAIISDYMDDESWFTADEALAIGFIDEIGDEVDLEDSLAHHSQELLSRFGGLKNTPKQFYQLSASAGTLRGDSPMPQSKGKEKVSDTDVDDQVLAKAKTEAASAALKEDGQRREAIASAFAKFTGHNELMLVCQNDIACTEQIARDKLLVALGSRDPGPSGADPVILSGESSVEKFNKAAGSALAVKAGLKVSEKDSDYAGDLRGHTLSELARRSLEVNQVNTAGMDKMQMVGMAFTHSSSDFPILLEETSRRSLTTGFDEMEEVFDQISRVVNLSDFKQTKSVGLSQFGDLDKIPENGEYKHGTIGEEATDGLKLATYGKMFGISRQAIINDDLDALVQIPRKMGMAAKRKIGDLVWDIFKSYVMADGKELFHAAHGNLITGGSLDVSFLGKGKVAMGSHKDKVTNRPYRISPAGLIVPNALEDKALTLMGAEFDPDATNPNTPNPYRGRYKVLAEPRLDEISVKDWYLAANALMQDVIGVGYLDGNSTPFLEQKGGWEVDGVQFKVRIDATAGALDYRTLQKIKGA